MVTVEKLSLLVDDHEVPNSSSSSPTSPTYSTEQPHSPIQQRNTEISQNPSLCAGLLSRLQVRVGKKGTRAILAVLLPSFLQRSYEYDSKLHPTSWLDGLRGVASLFVYVHHFILIWFPALSFGYASAPEFRFFFQMPFIRIIYAGRGMVTLFFVISGYVLSYSTLRKIRAGNFPAVLDTLASSVFRRWLRLFLPILVSTFTSMLITRMDLYIGSGAGRTETSWEQFWDWWREFVLLSNPTQGIGGEDVWNNHYSSQLWTIPRELRGSLVTYLVLLCLAKTRQGVRICCMAFLSWYTLWIQQWDLYLFLFGMMLAEIDLLRTDLLKGKDSTTLTNLLPKPLAQHTTKIMHAITISLSLLGVHFLTFPDDGASASPGYATMIVSTPATYGSVNLTQRYWLCLGAAILVAVMSLSPPISSSPKLGPLLQRPFTTKFAQYLGKISFGLYIMQYQILYTVGSRILNHSKGKSEWEYYLGFLVTVVVNSFLEFWVADLFWRGVDAKSVVLAKWVADKCFIK